MTKNIKKLVISKVNHKNGQMTSAIHKPHSPKCFQYPKAIQFHAKVKFPTTR